MAVKQGTNQHNKNRYITCPHCGRRSMTTARFCVICRGDLAQQADEASRAASAALRKDTGQLAPEVLVPRLGERLVEQGMLEKEALEFALKVQANRAQAGRPVLLGQLLVELGLIDRQTLDKVTIQQALELQRELEVSNRELERRVEQSTAQLKGALVKLSELSELKADFIANVSHELRTPLGILGGFLELVASESLGPLTEEQAAAMRSVMGASRRLEGLIENLLQFSEAAVGAIPLEMEAIALEKPVHRAVDRYYDSAHKKQVGLEIELSAALPRVQADRQKITWVIGEFLNNAIKYTPTGGLVRVRAVPQLNRVTLSVSDNGIGIPDDRIEEAFEPFHQLNGSMFRLSGGTGLGLALARRILEAHGSQVEVRSRLGEGSRFAFALPTANC